MKLGIFSDVHGNAEALDVVLDFLRGQGATSFVCCGDLVGYGPDPVRCVRTVAELRGLVVAGNHDYGVLERIPAEEFNQLAVRALAWTKKQLGEEELTYLDSLPLTEESEPFYIVHSSPSAPGQWEYVFMLHDAQEEMKFFSANVCLLGHSHYPFVVEQRGDESARLVKQSSFRVRPDVKYLINAGSVGQPRDGDPRACALLFDTRSRMMSVHRLEYDIKAVQEKMLRAGLPEFLAERLATGR